VLEWDELWSFVRSQEEPAWVWVALDRTTRPVVACCLGDRSEESGRFLWEQVPALWRQATCYTDFWAAYQTVIPEAQHVAGKGTGATAHGERWNNTLRQRLGAFVRKTLSFSKCDNLPYARLKLFLCRYNLTCV
jgi:insertion element IS1 protein InsB